MAERRHLLCNHCSGEFALPNELPSEPVNCPYCRRRVCGCGCGADLSQMRTNAIYEAESHWKRLKRSINTATTPTRSVAEARAIQEEGKAHWAMVADEGIYRHFASGPDRTLHADDLEPLGIPLEHRNVIGSQMAKWVNRGYMVECGRRKSALPSRNGAKSNEYRLTEKGRRHIAGDGAARTAGAVAGDGNSPGREAAATSSAAPRPGETATSGGLGAAGESRAACGSPLTEAAVGAGQTEGKCDQGRRCSSPAAGTDSPDRSVAEDLEEAEARLFDTDPVPMRSNSAFNPDSEWA